MPDRDVVPDRDLILLETVRTHRERLAAAFLFGAPEQRRADGDPIRRLARGLVLAALGCASCVGVGVLLPRLPGMGG